MASSTNGKASTSRFSSLRVFKFKQSSKSPSRSAIVDDGPPPLPPKDPSYLSRNYSQYSHSLASLSPDSASMSHSMPGSPLSPPANPNLIVGTVTSPSRPDLHNRAFNNSSMSLVSAVSRSSGVKQKKSGFFNFKKGSSMKSPSSRDTALDSGEDDNISMPWNFQVRFLYIVIHVNSVLILCYIASYTRR